MNINLLPGTFASGWRTIPALLTTLLVCLVIGRSNAQAPEAGKERLSEIGNVQNDKTLLAPPVDPKLQILDKEYAIQLRILRKELDAAHAEIENAEKQAVASRQRAQAAQAQLAAQQKELAERELKFAQMMTMQQRNQQLPPIENGAVVVFKLEKYPAADAAKTVESLLGTQPVRLAIDERSNSLIVFGKQDALPAVEELVRRLDEQDGASPELTTIGKDSSNAVSRASRSLLVRVFWLADGVPDDEGQDPHDYLPSSVIEATSRLGVVNPRLVSQTVNSLAVKGDEPIEFTTSVPAVVGGMTVGLNIAGRTNVAPENHVDAELKIDITGPMSCSLSGSLMAPLAHFVVLGTANSVIPNEPQVAGVMGGRGMGMGGGRMGRGGYGRGMEGGYGEMGRYGGGYGVNRPSGEGDMGESRGAVGGPAEGGVADEGEASTPPREPKYNTSRFAFVVQVIDGQSYPTNAPASASPSSENESEDDPFGPK